MNPPPSFPPPRGGRDDDCLPSPLAGEGRGRGPARTWGTAPIACAREGCGWTGLETDLVAQEVAPDMSVAVCPACGGNSYEYIETPEAGD